VIKATRLIELAKIYTYDFKNYWKFRERVRELKEIYSASEADLFHPIWTDEHSKGVYHSNFRADNVFVWQKRRYKKSSLSAAAQIACDLDENKLLDRLVEDSSYKVETFKFDRYVFSRDLIDSCLELNYLYRFFPRGVGTTLDLGAGYGRFAKRAIESDFSREVICIDSVPISTAVSEIYLKDLINSKKVHVLGLNNFRALNSHKIDLVVNIHSFSEMSLNSVDFWISLLNQLGVTWVFIVPNGPNLTLNDGSSFEGILRKNNYRIFDSRLKYGNHQLASLAMYPSTYYLLKRSE